MSSSNCLSENRPETWKAETSGGSSIGRPKKNKELQIGRAGRNAIEAEDIARESLRWQRRKQAIERFKAN